MTGKRFFSVLEKVLENSDIGVLLVTRKLYDAARDKINELKLTRRTPLIVSIPDSLGGNSTDFIKEYISEAIGVKM